MRAFILGGKSGLTVEEIAEIMAQRLTPKRFKHSLGVADTAVKLAEKNAISTEKAYLAGLVHDYARELPKQELLTLAVQVGEDDPVSLASPETLHAPVGSFLIEQELGISDQEILLAVASHTLGRRKMGKLEQIIYLADLIEPNRKFPGVERLRQAAEASLQTGIVLAIEHTIKYLVESGKLIHSRTIDARNYLIMEGNSV